MRKNSNAHITPKVPVIPAWAINNPPMAWPVTDAERYVPWLHVVAFCNRLRGTMLATNTEKVGPANERTIPVKKMIT